MSTPYWHSDAAMNAWLHKLRWQTGMLMRKYQIRLWVGRADKLPSKAK